MVIAREESLENLRHPFLNIFIASQLLSFMQKSYRRPMSIGSFKNHFLRYYYIRGIGDWEATAKVLVPDNRLNININFKRVK